MPEDTHFKLFQLMLNTKRTDYIATNDTTQQNTQALKNKAPSVGRLSNFTARTGRPRKSNAANAEKERSQRNHTGIAMLV